MTRWSQGMQKLSTFSTVEAVVLLAAPSLFVVLFLWFGVRSLRHGVPHSKRVDALAVSRWMPRYFLEYGVWALGLFLRVVLALRLTANTITLLSLVLATGGGYFIGQGRFALGGWLMLAAFFCDALDGMVARHTGSASARGEFLDSVVDRYADFAVGTGFLWYYRDVWWAFLIVAAAMVGSQVMGYARAKGDAVGVDPKIGWMQRHERAVYLGGGTVLSPIVSAFIEPLAYHPRHWLALLGLSLVAVLTNASAVWRSLYVMERLPRSASPASTDAPQGDPRPPG